MKILRNKYQMKRNLGICVICATFSFIITLKYCGFLKDNKKSDIYNLTRFIWEINAKLG